jgi:alkanesulfonate monooxygenase SsuD/methylene tetrahydromethanopterin reductase-like flavin-dependent oxidoreductase (luciferase family)
VLTQPPPLPSTRGVALPGLDEVFARGLHQDPAQRYAIATDFVEALEQVLSRSGTDLPGGSARQPPAAAPAPRPTRPPVGAAVAVWLNRLALRLVAAVQ